MKKFWQSLKAVIASIVSASRATWIRLTELEQKISVEISGLLAVVTQHVGKPDDIIWGIASLAFPTLTKEMALAYLAKGAAILGIADSIANWTWATAIAAVQAWCLPLIGDAWAKALGGLFNVIYNAFAPNGTFAQTVLNIRDWLYATFVKPKVATV